MPRVKRGVQHVKRRASLRKKVKGYKWGRKNTVRLAKTAVAKAGQHALRDRRKKKRVARALWLTKLNAALTQYDWSYSKFMGALKKANIELDRKVLADLAEHEPKAFEAIVKLLKK